MIQRWAIRVSGVVQGVGFRPFARRLADACGVSGWVRNDCHGVELEIQGEPARLAEYCDRLVATAPPSARIAQCDVIARDLSLVSASDAVPFKIDASTAAGDVVAHVPPDLAICDPCLAELENPEDRRYRYPLITCMHCGPRLTILRRLPYDRPATTMAAFPLCSSCAREYDDPTDRRYHAQPIACWDCGPQVTLRTADGETLARGDVIAAARRAIAFGQVVAIKGIGGYHLACDATCGPAVRRLRERKQRFDKPLAVMVRDLATCRRLVATSPLAEAVLVGPERPIVLLRKRVDGLCAAPEVAPQSSRLGVMLAYSPLHFLLLQPGDAWVMTSGNLSEEPIAYRDDDARERLAKIADAFLVHDREISIPCDDSVVQIHGNRITPIRRSRGYAPLPVRLPGRLANAQTELLAVGGELKATLCLTKGGYGFLSPHLGDMENVETLSAMDAMRQRLCQLYELAPRTVVADLHPGYASVVWARQLASRLGIAFLQVQHHHAHLAALIAEHGLDPDAHLIGVCFDGSGYGTDGHIWGGEVLIANAAAFRRWGHLGYLPLPGGDACARHPARTALAYLHAAGIAWDDRLPPIAAVATAHRKLLHQQLQRPALCPLTSSAGRLFDAVASLCGLCHSASFEGQAAQRLERLAEQAADVERQPYSLDWRTSPLDLRPLLHAVVGERLAGTPAAVTAARFHATLAEGISQACVAASKQTGRRLAGLSGGTFQNALLTRLTVNRLEQRDFDVLVHRIVPPNDGGLALGQAVIAVAS